MAQWVVTTPPAVLPVSVYQAAAQAVVDDMTRDAVLLNDLITAATDYAETETGLSFINRTIQATYYPERSDVLPEAAPIPPYTQLPLFRPPVSSVTSVVDRYGKSLVWESRSVGYQDFVQLEITAVAPVVITYVAGYGATSATVPAIIKRSILAHVSHMYRYREAGLDTVPEGLESVYRNFRPGGGM